MNTQQKETIARLRIKGYSYTAVGQEIGLKESTVKTYCSRHGLTDSILRAKHCCKMCGAPIHSIEKRRSKVFCSDHCRAEWWNKHHRGKAQKTVYHFVCLNCGQPFESHGNKSRKYCSHNCYISARFGKGRGSNE